jgi:hypothetical protein
MSHLPAPPRSPVQMWFPAAGLKCGIAGPNEGHAMLAPFFLHVNSLQVAPAGNYRGHFYIWSPTRTAALKFKFRRHLPCVRVQAKTARHHLHDHRWQHSAGRRRLHGAEMQRQTSAGHYWRVMMGPRHLLWMTPPRRGPPRQARPSPWPYRPLSPMAAIAAMASQACLAGGCRWRKWPAPRPRLSAKGGSLRRLRALLGMCRHGNRQGAGRAELDQSADRLAAIRHIRLQGAPLVEDFEMPGPAFDVDKSHENPSNDGYNKYILAQASG